MIETLLQVTNLSGTTVYLDLYDDITINMNMSFAEVQDITSRNSGYSQTFRVPGTKKNNEFFNYMFNVNQEGLSFDFQKSVVCSINYKGNTVLDGVLRLLKVYVLNNLVEYEVNVQDEVGIFINDISNKLLMDIDFTDLTHPYNSTNVIDSWTATYTGGTTSGGLFDGQVLYPFTHNGYLYDGNGNVITTGQTSSPLLEMTGAFGTISNSLTPMKLFAYKPSIQIKSVINRIFNQNGYTVESDFFNTEFFQRLYMPLMFNTEDYFISYTGGTNGTSSIGLFEDETINAYNFSGTTCLSLEGVVGLDTLFSNNGPDYTTTGYGWDVVDGKFYPWANGDYTFKSSVTFYNPTIGPDYYISGRTYYIVNRTTEYPISNFKNGIIETVNDFSGKTITLTVGDYVEYGVKWVVSNTPTGCDPVERYINPIIKANQTNVDVVAGPSLLVNAPVNLALQITPTPEYKQLDFLKGLITHFNLVMVKHPYKTNTYIMEPYDDYVGSGNGLDWTDKLDVSKTIEITPVTTITGKAIEYNYEDDADATNTFTKSLNNNRIFGTYNFIPSGVTINDQPIKFTSFFSPSPCDILTGGGLFNPFIVPQFYGAKQITVAGATKTQLLPMRIKPRMLYYGGMKPTSITWYYRNEQTSTTIPYNEYPFTSHQTTLKQGGGGADILDLNFGYTASPQDQYSPTETEFTIFNEFYRAYIEDLLDADARLVTAHFFLEIEDIVNLQFSDLIFVKDTYYRINKIVDFNLVNPGTTKVELLKLLRVDLQGILPPPPSFGCRLNTEADENIKAENNDYINPEFCLPGPTPTPTPTPTSTPTPTPSGPTPTPTPTPTATPTPTPSGPTPTPTPTPTSTPTPTPTLFSCTNCRTWQYNNVPVEGDVIFYYDCNTGVQQSIAVNQGDTGTFCNCNDVGNPTALNSTQLTDIAACSVTPTPTPTPTATPTPTPTGPTPTPTPTATPTPTPTPTSSCTVQVTVDNNATVMGIDIVYVNGVAVTYDSGDDFTVQPGELGFFTTNEIGTYTVDVSYTAFSGVDRNINLIDCNGNAFCCDNLNTAGGTCVFENVVINCPCGGGIQIIANNGQCL